MASQVTTTTPSLGASESLVMNPRQLFSKAANARLTGRSRVSILLAVSIAFIFSVAINLHALYDRNSYGYRGGNPKHTVTMTFLVLLSLILLAILSTVTRNFLSSLIVGLTGMGLYIYITFLVDPWTHGHGRVIATWSVLTFWIFFVVEAVLGYGYQATGWMEARLEDRDLGRIRLGSDEANTVLPHEEYRDIPTPRALQVDQVAAVAALDLERGERSPPKADSVA
ncbi:uncharacterized protein B0I36DRAFT_331464 [Microdochium trichocladiopsis]|uniref:Uncharacterized protein n=1 Tax=Microdochium trichocladiopsis TaxID=1682393 RepID=A0A9P9BIP4_9PEZI|nr:uncharacterized protein B0I36DRAFT_331464 [Microdochium trichocladiopsis]KAH7024458.1 hypothetical protein B0I36DRAFT_331464 [Microdochium trichocladiopsis]